jgi:hypothetical protein
VVDAQGNRSQFAFDGHPGERRPGRSPLPVRGAARGRGDRGVRRLHVLIALDLHRLRHLRRLPRRQRAERRQDFDRAVLEYSKAVQEHPDNIGYRKGLQTARLRASAEHTMTGRRLLNRGPLQGSAGRAQARPRPQSHLVHAAARDRGGGDPAQGELARGHPRPAAGPHARAQPARARARPRGAGAAGPVLPQREPARGLPGPGQGGRSATSCSTPSSGDSHHGRPQGRGLRAGPQRHRQRRPHLPPRARLAGGHGGAGHAQQAPRTTSSRS